MPSVTSALQETAKKSTRPRKKSAPYFFLGFLAVEVGVGESWSRPSPDMTLREIVDAIHCRTTFCRINIALEKGLI